MTPTYTQLVAARTDAPTMTSLELVDFINADRKQAAEAEGAAFPSKGFAVLAHADFLKKVPEVLGVERAGNFSVTFDVPGPNGATRKSKGYRFSKREACLMAMSYSYDLQAKVFDRMTALEARNTPVALPVLPKTFAEALRALADKSEESERQAAALALAAPKVEFVDRYVTADTGAKGFRQVCKLLKANEARFREFLAEERIMYRLQGDLVAYQPHIDAGRFECKTGEANGHAFSRCLFSPKGVEWVAGEWAKRQIRDAVEPGLFA